MDRDPPDRGRVRPDAFTAIGRYGADGRRMTANGNGTIDNTELLSTHDYYPFGLEWQDGEVFNLGHTSLYIKGESPFFKGAVFF